MSFIFPYNNNIMEDDWTLVGCLGSFLFFLTLFNSSQFSFGGFMCFWGSYVYSPLLWGGGTNDGELAKQYISHYSGYSD